MKSRLQKKLEEISKTESDEYDGFGPNNLQVGELYLRISQANTHPTQQDLDQIHDLIIEPLGNIKSLPRNALLYGADVYLNNTLGTHAVFHETIFLVNTYKTSGRTKDLKECYDLLQNIVDEGVYEAFRLCVANRYTNSNDRTEGTIIDLGSFGRKDVFHRLGYTLEEVATIAETLGTYRGFAHDLKYKVQNRTHRCFQYIDPLMESIYEELGIEIIPGSERDGEVYTMLI